MMFCVASIARNHTWKNFVEWGGIVCVKRVQGEEVLMKIVEFGKFQNSICDLCSFCSRKAIFTALEDSTR